MPPAFPPLVIDNPSDSPPQPITVGLPFPQGLISNSPVLELGEAGGTARPVQSTPLAHWPDGSVRWLLLDFLTGPLTAGQHVWQLRQPHSNHSTRQSIQSLVFDSARQQLATGVADFRFAGMAEQPLFNAGLTGPPSISAFTTRLKLTDSAGETTQPRIRSQTLECEGPIRSTVRIEGEFTGAAACRVTARLSFFAGLSLACCQLTLHNPRRATHRGNLWDLGDPGSIYFRDLTLELSLNGAAGSQVRWKVEPECAPRISPAHEFEIYQDSSGGENWQSPNHVNRQGRVPTRFRGYRIRADGTETLGLRASPVVQLLGPTVSVSAAIPEFWQQFPKAIDADGGSLRLRLFPQQSGDLFELQGGEQKTHTIWLEFGPANSPETALDWVHRPAIARATPEWYAGSGAFPDVIPQETLAEGRLDAYLRPLIEGPKSLVARREVIDEYGWRNFGDIHADHENAYYDGPKPVISHYNNQFDSVYGALLQFARTGDCRWREISDPLARHVIDIDIYHTDEDRAAYRGGLFWMTDHYKDAATSTHRTFSRSNQKPGTSYGGGPGAEHNFTTGLLYYYYMTGDPLARDAVISLADWVIRMDDGRLTRWRWLDDGPTGLASMTGSLDYHGPGRGAGLSINALLDGWALTNDRKYLDFAETVIRRCIHPNDDIAARDLLDIERRWSYTIFLSSLTRYLQAKTDLNEFDTMYDFARESLVRYADWMVRYERPNFDQRERMEFPTETWAAQDLRKANVLRLAAAYAGESERAAMHARGNEIADRAWRDLSSFDSQHVARAVAIVLTEGTRDQKLRGLPAAIPNPNPHRTDLGCPESFVPQKARIKALLRSPVGWSRILRRLVSQVAGARS